MRNLHIVFQNDCSNVHFHQQYTEVPFLPHAYQNSLSFFLFYNSNPVMCKYLILVLICISLMISDIEHYFKYLLIIWISSLEKILINFSFFNWIICLFCNWVWRVLYKCWILTSYLIMFANIFSIFICCLFILLRQMLHWFCCLCEYVKKETPGLYWDYIQIGTPDNYSGEILWVLNCGIHGIADAM